MKILAITENQESLNNTVQTVVSEVSCSVGNPVRVVKIRVIT